MKSIDWEERRYEIALHAMQGIIANSHAEIVELKVTAQRTRTQHLK